MLAATNIVADAPKTLDDRERWLLAAAAVGRSLLMQLVGGYRW